MRTFICPAISRRIKGHLPWPVTGTISMAFGEHEYIPNIWHNNIGVTIDVAAGAAVKSVFKGVVQSVFSIGDVCGDDPAREIFYHV
jgi:pyruvate/2-oxoglutarate dehydrogenase complex dihydrolipoamide dehydrogenase (E3) component